MSVYYITRWFNYEKRLWCISTMGKEPSLEQAEEQLEYDISYFYSDIPIEMVRVEETVIKTVNGSQKRGQP